MVFRRRKFHFGDGTIKKAHRVIGNPETGMVRIYWTKRWRTYEKNPGKEIDQKHYIEIPREAIVGDQIEVINRSYTFDVPMYDKLGNPVDPRKDFRANFLRRIKDLEERLIFEKSTKDHLRFEIHELLKTRKDLTDEVAGTLKKMSEAAAPLYPRGRGKSAPPPMMPHDQFPPGEGDYQGDND